MDGIAGVVAGAPPEGLSGLGPVGLVVELPGVEHDLVHDLGDLDGVGRWAGTARLESAARGVRDMALVIGRVGVLAIPARGKVTVTRQPPPQALGGKFLVSEPVQGAPPKGLCCMLDSQRKHKPEGTPLAWRLPGSPTSMRKPCVNVSHGGSLERGKRGGGGGGGGEQGPDHGRVWDNARVTRVFSESATLNAFPSQHLHVARTSV